MAMDKDSRSLRNRAYAIIDEGPDAAREAEVAYFAARPGLAELAERVKAELIKNGVGVVPPPSEADEEA